MEANVSDMLKCQVKDKILNVQIAPTCQQYCNPTLTFTTNLSTILKPNPYILHQSEFSTDNLNGLCAGVFIPKSFLGCHATLQFVKDSSIVVASFKQPILRAVYFDSYLLLFLTPNFFYFLILINDSSNIDIQM